MVVRSHFPKCIHLSYRPSRCPQGNDRGYPVTCATAAALAEPLSPVASSSGSTRISSIRARYRSTASSACRSSRGDTQRPPANPETRHSAPPPGGITPLCRSASARFGVRKIDVHKRIGPRHHSCTRLVKVLLVQIPCNPFLSRGKPGPCPTLDRESWNWTHPPGPDRTPPALGDREQAPRISATPSGGLQS